MKNITILISVISLLLVFYKIIYQYEFDIYTLIYSVVYMVSTYFAVIKTIRGE